jgi:3-deoxy-D-manno-octulosonic-acid transferase
MLLDIYKKLKMQHPTLVLVIVPRHPHRFDDVHQLMKATGYQVTSVSQAGIKDKSKATSANASPVDCLLVDKMGWLKACYSICTVAFVGGSFAPKGGHNALEAALYSKPIAMGNSIFNNPTICQHLVAQNALKITHTSDELYEVCKHWLSNKKEAAADGEKGLEVLLKNAGSVEYTMSLLRPML